MRVIDMRHSGNLRSYTRRSILVDAFPLSGWLIMTVPPVLMILSVVIFYMREVRRERLEDDLLKRDVERGG